MNVSNVQMPDPSDGVMSGAVSYAYVAGDAINSFAVNTAVPSRMTGKNNAGLLPLNVTFNLPKNNQLVAPKWSELLNEWRSTGTIRVLPPLPVMRKARVSGLGASRRQSPSASEMRRPQP